MNIRGSLMGRFKLGVLKMSTFYFFIPFFIGEFGPFPKNSGPNPRTFLFWVGVTLGPWKPPPAWPNPSYVPG